MLQAYQEEGKVSLNCLPHNFGIHPKILMDEFVSHAADLTPGYFRSHLTHLFGDFLRRLSDNFQCAYDSIDCLLIRFEFRKRHVLHKGEGLFSIGNHVKEIIQEPTSYGHTGTASLKIA